MTYFWFATFLAGCLLQVLVISSLIRDSYKIFPFLLANTVADLLSNVAGSAAYFRPDLYSAYVRHYWVGEAVQQFLMFCLVISLIRQTVKDRSRLQHWLAPGVIAIAALSLYRKHGNFNMWMTELSRNLSFIAVLLNLYLWMALIRHKPDDRRLLLISGGLGLQMAGSAIGHALREMAKVRAEPLVTTGNLVIVVSHLLCLYVWWQALRKDTALQVATNYP
jgi:hypothetical protein